MREELLKGLTEEQIAKIKACNSSEELLELAKAEGVELSEEQLNAISGGGLICSTENNCPQCGAGYDDIMFWSERFADGHETVHYECKKCQCQWTKNR